MSKFISLVQVIMFTSLFTYTFKERMCKFMSEFVLCNKCQELVYYHEIQIVKRKIICMTCLTKRVVHKSK